VIPSNVDEPQVGHAVLGFSKMPGERHRHDVVGDATLGEFTRLTVHATRAARTLCTRGASGFPPPFAGHAQD
jgi:hypothetical protein